MNKFLGLAARRRRAFALAGLAALLCTSGVQTTISPVSSRQVYAGDGVIWESDMAYDPINQRYLTVFRKGDSGPFGQFMHYDGTNIVEDGLPFLLVAGGFGGAPRVAGRTIGSGGFLVTYFQGNHRYALFVQPGTPTQLSPVLDLGTEDAEHLAEGAGLAYAPDYDRFLVTFPRNRHTFITAVTPSIGPMTKTADSQITTSTGQCNGEYLHHPEIAYDPVEDVALVTGWRDVTECSAGGGVWARIVGFNGSEFSLNNIQQLWLSQGPYDEEMRVAFGEVSRKFVVVWSRRTGNTRSVMRAAISTLGSFGTPAAILPPNLGNSSPGDDAFNQLGLGYNATTNRFLMGMRGNDAGGVPNAPAFVLELTGDGDAVAGTMAEYLPVSPGGVNQPPYPWPVLIAIPGTSRFAALTKAGSFPSPHREQIDLWSSVIDTNGLVGTGWPTGGGGGTPVTVGIAKPVGGTITGGGVNCGDLGNVCSITGDTGTAFTLSATPSAGFTFGGWAEPCPGGTITFGSSTWCGAAFNPTGGSPVTVGIAKPVGGTITGGGVNCGDLGNVCSITSNSGTVVVLSATASAGYAFGGWAQPCPGGAVTFGVSTWCGAAFNQTGGGSPVTVGIAKPAGGTITGGGVNCGDGGNACSITGNSGTVAVLTATASPGFIFGSWAQPCPGGVVTFGASTWCGAAFNNGGGGGGGVTLVVTKPTGGTILGPGINCGDGGNACQVTMPSGVVLGFDIAVTPGNTFTSWAAGCPNGVVTFTGNPTCGANFNGGGGGGGNPTLTIVNPGAGGGGGLVLGPEIACQPGATNLCSVSVPPGTVVNLIALPYPGFSFAGWVGAGCANSMTLTASKTCTADFNRN